VGGVLTLLFWSILLCPATAQDFSSLAASMPGMAAVVLKLCPDTPEFSAKTTVEIVGKQGELQTAMTIGLALRETNMWQDLNVAKMPQLPPNVRAAMIIADLDRIIIITRVDRNLVYVVFPGVEAYSAFPIPDAVLHEIKERDKAASFDSTPIGEEIVDGHPCMVTKLVVTEPGRPTDEAILWRASDLDGFPVKIEVRETRRTTKLDFSKVEVGRPDQSLFEVPTNYLRLATTAEILAHAKARTQQAPRTRPTQPPN